MTSQQREEGRAEGRSITGASLSPVHVHARRTSGIALRHGYPAASCRCCKPNSDTAGRSETPRHSHRSHSIPSHSNGSTCHLAGTRPASLASRTGCTLRVVSAACACFSSRLPDSFARFLTEPRIGHTRLFLRVRRKAQDKPGTWAGARHDSISDGVLRLSPENDQIASMNEPSQDALFISIFRTRSRLRISAGPPLVDCCDHC